MYKQIAIMFLSLLALGNVYAATPAAGATSSAKIEDLKERLATKVAELRQIQKKAIVGTVKSVSISSVTIETKTSDVKIELTDDIRVFQTIKGTRTTLTTENVEKDDYVVVFGDYDTTLDLLKAKVIVIQSPLPLRISGIVSEVDKKNYTVTLTATGGQTYIVDIEKNTSMLARDAEKGIVKGGFSKVESGNAVHITGSEVPKKENRISAIRFIDLGNMSGITPTPTAAASATPSASPTVTAKPTSAE